MTRSIRCQCGTWLSKVGDRSNPIHIECIHRTSPRELFEALVDNAAAWREEDPARMVYALDRIAKAERKKVDDVFLELRARVKERTGMSRLPGEALNTN